MTHNDLEADPGPRPEGELVRLARQSHPQSPSMRQAALWADVSETLWRQLESGYESRAGLKLRVRVGDEKLANMAWVVGADPDELARYRPEAVKIYRAILARRGVFVPPVPAVLSSFLSGAARRDATGESGDGESWKGNGSTGA